ncbi:L-type lectin-like domain-containing protein [Aphelenchoides besseyi]|nr:L-type lectin-like domain-containing protein [Aphelenchoides besseyi]KAI6229399.1 L-type lectin-like domain-containing protein [Aphelenchoides besseyi]
MRLQFVAVVLITFVVQICGQEDVIDGSFVTEQRGYFKREHSLIKPYQGAGMDVNYWDITGSTMVTSQQIRLTQNLQGRRGGIWNAMPVQTRDWEMSVSFKVHGDSGKLFGDGIAVWYVRDRAQIGDVFGSPNHFSGLGLFIDTYSNSYKDYMARMFSFIHTFPYIYSMLSNGTDKYDHDTDGSATQLGGGDAGCEVKVRNKEYDTQVLIRYVGDTLTVFEDTENNGRWKQCFRVPGVHLPTNYYFGLTAATGDLSDNHDIISVKVYEIEYARAVNPMEINPGQILPNAEFQAAPRDHSSNPQPSKLSSWAKYLLIFIGIVATVGGIAVFGYLYYQDRQSRSRKRFY